MPLETVTQSDSSATGGADTVHRPRRWWPTIVLAVIALTLLPSADTLSYLLPVLRPLPVVGGLQGNADWFIGIPALLLYLLAVPVLLVLIAGFRGRRLQALAVLVALVVGGWSTLAFTKDWAGRTALRRLVDFPPRAAPLISALDAYQRETGRYPPSLRALVPKYIRKIPDTGLAGYPTFDYFRSEDGFELHVNNVAAVAPDGFVYRSDQDYSHYPRASPVEDVLRGKSPRGLGYIMPDGWLYRIFD